MGIPKPQNILPQLVQNESARAKGAGACDSLGVKRTSGSTISCYTASTTRLAICTFLLLAKHRPKSPFRPYIRNMGSTSGQVWPTKLQLGPNFGPLGSNFGPTGRRTAQVGLHMGSTLWTWPAQYEILIICVSPLEFCAIFCIDEASCRAMFPVLCPNLLQSCRQTAPSWAMLDMTWTYMCIAWLQLGVHLGRLEV